MKKLSTRLSNKLIAFGNLPISAEGLVRLQPEIAGNLVEAQSVLRNEVESYRPDNHEDPVDRTVDDFLVARFVAGSERTEQLHLFMMETPHNASHGDRIKRWSKRPVSYGSFVQIRRYLRDVWGEVRNLEVERVYLQLESPT